MGQINSVGYSVNGAVGREKGTWYLYDFFSFTQFGASSSVTVAEG